MMYNNIVGSKQHNEILSGNYDWDEHFKKVNSNTKINEIKKPFKISYTQLGLIGLTVSLIAGYYYLSVKK